MTIGNMLPRALALLVTVFAWLWSANAAAVTNTYYADPTCRGVTYQDELKIYRNGAGSMTVSDADIVCPIIKTTSAPNVSNDLIASTTPRFGMAAATCTYSEYSTQVTGDTNALFQSTASGSGYQFTLGFSGVNTGFWGDANNWKYAELRCRVTGNFHYITVVENGSQRSGRRISSAAWCSQDFDSDPAQDPTSPYRYILGKQHIPYTAGATPGGYAYSVGGAAGFHARCSMPLGSGSKVDVRLGPALGDQQMGCMRNGTWLSIPGLNGQSGQYNFQTIKFVSGGSGELNCYMAGYPSLGDAKLLSFRTYN